MSKRVQLILGAVVGCLVVGLLLQQTPEAQAQAKPKEPTFLHGLFLRVRKAGEPNFTDKTKRWGVEAFKDENTGHVLYITEDGHVSAYNPTGAVAPKETTAPKWLHGLEVPVRTAAEENWGPDTKRFGMEAFKDEALGNAVVMAESGSLATLPMPGPGVTTQDARTPSWQTALVLKCRKAGEEGWKDAKKWGIELYKDENSGNVVFITENGKVALLPAAAASKLQKGKTPEWSHAMEIKCRKAGESEWKDARKWGIEVFKDENSGMFVYLCESGSIALAPAPAGYKPPEKSKEPTWTHGIELKCRKPDETWKEAKKFGLEVFKDDNTGATIYLTETGSLGVVPGK
jgi:hypothetical protein